MSESRKQLLKDSWIGRELSLLESIDIPKGKCSNSVVLASLKGPVMDFINDTRNGRLYEESLCDLIAESSYVKELQETNNFLGEPDHPMTWEDRTDIHYPNVSHAIRDLVKVEEEGCYKATIDILDTPNGRILKTLLDYGTKLGLSSRGIGRVIKRSDGRSIVDSSVYKFFTFDIVAMPGNKSARLNNQSDSINEPLAKALAEQVSNLVLSKDISSLESTKNVLNYLDFEGCSSLVEKVDSFLYKEKNADKRYVLENSSKKDIEANDVEIKKLDKKEKEKDNDLEDTSLVSNEKEIIKASVLNGAIMKKELGYLKDILINSIDKIELLSKQNDNLTSQINSLRNKEDKPEEDSEDNTGDNSTNESYSNYMGSITKQYKELVNEYFFTRCKELGLNESIMINKLGRNISDYTYDEIDKKLLETMKSIKHGNNLNDLVDNKVTANYLNSSLQRNENSIENDYLCGISDIVSTVKNM